MTEIKEKIIRQIRKNRVSTTEVADCMNKTGAIDGVTPLTSGFHKVGEVFWAYAFNESNWEFHEQVREIPERNIVLCHTFDCKDRAVFGSLVSKFLLLYQQAEAIVVDGHLRDAPHLIKERWPIWIKGVTPIGCFNKKNETPFNPDIIERYREKYQGAIGVCDDSGVVVIEKKFHTQEFLDKLDWIEEQEDTWFDCIDRRKWDTYDTVCLKKYKDE